MDITTCPLAKTWRNGWLVVEGVTKLIKMFLVSTDLLPLMGRYMSYLENVDLSNHVPIYLQVEGSNSKVRYPFKYNHPWAALDDFRQLN